MNKVFSLLLVLSVVSSSFAVDFNDYKPLRSAGQVPQDFTERTSSKVAKDVTVEVDANDKNRVKAAKSEFLLKANYMVDELLMSGKVLFGDEVSQYVNKVADKLLESNKELRSKLRFYVLKSNVTNAFATNQGMIFVTLGLISQIETEAQLAFVLGHEVIHYENKHLISTILEADKSQANKRSYYKNYDDNIRKLSKYSRTLETESDSLGFYYLEKAGYDLKAGLQVMDVLQFSYLPFEEEAFDYSMFETEHFKLPSKFKLDTIVPINFEYDEDDSKSSHPNLNKRRSTIEDLIKKSGKKGTAFHYPKEEFFKIRNICRMESIRLNLKDGMYTRSIYNTSILLREFKDSKYLKNSLAKGLYGVAKFHGINKYHRIVRDYSDYEGNISSVFYMFEKMEAKDVMVLAVRQMWMIYQETEDKFIKELLDNLIYDLVALEKVSLDDFYKELPAKNVADKTEVKEIKKEEEEEEETSGGKYSKIKTIKKEVEKAESSPDADANFYKTILYDLPQKQEFEKLYKNIYIKYQKELDEIEIEKKKYDHLSPRAKAKAIEKDRLAAYKSSGDKSKLGAEKIVFIDPEYYSVDERKGVKLVNSEDKKYQLYANIEEVSKALNMDNDILTPKLFNANDAEKFNDLVIINEWVGERMRLDGVKDGWNFIPLETEYSSIVADKYGTNYFSYAGVIEYNEIKRGVGWAVFGLFIPYTTLFSAYYLVSPAYSSYVYSSVYDLKSGQRINQDLYKTNNRLKNSHIKSFMYHSMYVSKMSK
jgi:Zn-dependent protease with chaperone function